MCYYNNRFVDSSRCEGGKNYIQPTIFGNICQLVTGPTGPTGPCCELSSNVAQVVSFP